MPLQTLVIQKLIKIQMTDSHRQLWQTRSSIMDELTSQYEYKRELDHILHNYLRWNTYELRNRREIVQMAIDCLEVRLQQINRRLSISSSLPTRRSRSI